MFFWEWREIHLYFHNLPVKQPSYVGGNCKTFHWTSWGVFVQSQRGKKRLFSCQEAVAEIRKKNPKKLQKWNVSFSVPFSSCSRDTLVSPGSFSHVITPGSRKKQLFQTGNREKLASFLFSSPCSRGLSVSTGTACFPHAGFCGIRKYPFPRGRWGWLSCGVSQQPPWKARMCWLDFLGRIKVF